MKMLTGAPDIPMRCGSQYVQYVGGPVKVLQGLRALYLATWSLWVCTLCISTCSSLQNGRGDGRGEDQCGTHTQTLCISHQCGQAEAGGGGSVLVMSTWGQAGLARHLQVQSTGLYRQASIVYTTLATMHTTQARSRVDQPKVPHSSIPHRRLQQPGSGGGGGRRIDRRWGGPV